MRIERKALCHPNKNILLRGYVILVIEKLFINLVLEKLKRKEFIRAHGGPNKILKITNYYY